MAEKQKPPLAESAEVEGSESTSLEIAEPFPDRPVADPPSDSQGSCDAWISRREARTILGLTGKQIPDRLLDEFLNHILLIAQTSVDLTQNTGLSSKGKKPPRKSEKSRHQKRRRTNLRKR